MDVFKEQDDLNLKNFKKFLDKNFDKSEQIQFLNLFINTFNETAKEQPKSICVNFSSVTNELKLHSENSPFLILGNTGITLPNLDIENIKILDNTFPEVSAIVNSIENNEIDLVEKIEQKHSHELVKYISKFTETPSIDITPFKQSKIRYEEKADDIFLSTEESADLEFKSSLIAPVDRYTYEPLNLYELEEIKGKNESQVKEFINNFQKNIQHSFLKALAGMLNVRGGIIRVGVADTGKVLGIEQDLKMKFENETLEKAKDRYEVWISGSFLPNNLTKDASSYILINFIDVADKTFLEVQALPSREPIYVKSKDKRNEIGDFYTRQGTSTNLLDGQYRDNYIKNNFPKRVSQQKITWTLKSLKKHLVQSSDKNLSYFFECLDSFCKNNNLKINILSVSEGVIEIKIPHPRKSLSLFSINSSFNIIFELKYLRRSDFFKVDRNLREISTNLFNIFEDGIQQNKTNIENNVYIYLKTLEQKDKVDKFFKYLSTLLNRYHIFQSRRFS